MSHMVTVKTSLKSRDTITKALTRLGYTYQEGDFTVTEYGKSAKAQILLDKSLGLSQQADGTWAFVGDPYHCSTQKLRRYYGKMNNFTKELSTAYIVEEDKQILEEQQFYCVENEEALVGDDGKITMVYQNLG